MNSPLPTGTVLQWSGQTDRGTVRQNNEDAFLGLQFNAREVQLLGKSGEISLAGEDAVFAVSDGMGGARAGEFASRIAIDKITRLLPHAFKQSAVGLEAGFSDVLTELFSQIHLTMLLMGCSYEDCHGMGATLSLCWFTPGWMYYAHLGDSRVYYFPAATARIKQLTEDDTHVGWLLRSGQINEYEARRHPGRHSLQRALGADYQFVTPAMGAVSFEPGDQFLLCTDGLTDGLFDHQLEAQFQSAPNQSMPQITQELIGAALESSGRDNITALAVRCL